MTKPTQDAQKDLKDWSTGDEPMTGPQASYLQTLSRETGQKFDDSLTKSKASAEIDRLQKLSRRARS